MPANLFQASWDQADEKGTVLQVVDNPSWLTPYFACVLVAAGMIWQFLSHLIGFAAKRNPHEIHFKISAVALSRGFRSGNRQR